MVWLKLILLHVLWLFSTDVQSHPLHMSGRAIGQNIRQLPCKGKNSFTKGVCMFALDCIKSNGTHLGTCIDRFYFGSCCDVPRHNTDKYTSSKPSSSNHIDGSTFELGSTIRVKTTATTPTVASTIRPPPSTAVTNAFVVSSSVLDFDTDRWDTSPISSTESPTTSLMELISTELPSTSTSSAQSSWTFFDEQLSVFADVPSTETVPETEADNMLEPTTTQTVPPTTTKSTSTLRPTVSTTMQQFFVTTNASATRPPPTTTTTAATTTAFASDFAPTTEIFDITKLEDLNYKAVCGRQLYKAKPTGRIVNGQKTQFGEWPWQISLRQWKRTTFMHKCGAALLNENWAITAAHCVDGVPPEDLLLRIGEFDLSSDSESLRHVERRVQIMTTHPDFNSRTFENDLALLRFYDPVKFQQNILPICLPTDDNNYVNKTGYVTGWGRLYVDGPLPNILQEVQVPVITNAECEQEYRKAGFLESIPDIFLCAGYDEGGRDSCEGDSGGPLVIKRSDDRWLLAGIISWGIGCAEPHQPGVYTRITKFKDWINQILVF